MVDKKTTTFGKISEVIRVTSLNLKLQANWIVWYILAICCVIECQSLNKAHMSRVSTVMVLSTMLC